MWARMLGCVRGGRGVKTERQRGKQDGRAFSLVGTEMAGIAGVSHQDVKISREHYVTVSCAAQCAHGGGFHFEIKPNGSEKIEEMCAQALAAFLGIKRKRVTMPPLPFSFPSPPPSCCLCPPRSH